MTLATRGRLNIFPNFGIIRPSECKIIDTANIKVDQNSHICISFIMDRDFIRKQFAFDTSFLFCLQFLRSEKLNFQHEFEFIHVLLLSVVKK